MKKSYRYRGFVIIVKSALLTVKRDEQHPNVRLGYLAVVRLDAVCTPSGFSTKSFEVGAASGRLFKREMDVFAGGYKAATQIIDEVFAMMDSDQGPSAARSERRPSLVESHAP